MSNTLLKIENVSKRYRLGEVGTGTISHDLNRWWAKVRGKEDPFAKIGEVNDRTKKAESDYVWALRDINFEVKEGEVLGIIGKNGAGKSTLLKVLSQVTGPSTGRIYSKGRIASLLEVGTGFHPELTGRENVFLNGAILGMTKAEIKSQFDAIVDFAGVERYIDTPVKRYSSGMMVRLGFAVAAHLEPEILIVDEVLAVGDIEFQNKCIGKMGEVSKSGRTILFVSHNMSAIRNLCTRGMVVDNGQLAYNGSVEKALGIYIKSNSSISKSGLLEENRNANGTGVFVVKSINTKNESRNDNIYFLNETVQIDVALRQGTLMAEFTLGVAVRLYDENDICISNDENVDRDFNFRNKNGEIRIHLTYTDLRLYPGTYKIQVVLGSSDWSEQYDITPIVPIFRIENGSPTVKRNLSQVLGKFYLNPEWS